MRQAKFWPEHAVCIGILHATFRSDFALIKSFVFLDRIPKLTGTNYRVLPEVLGTCNLVCRKLLRHIVKVNSEISETLKQVRQYVILKVLFLG